jgi:hypothetical protein
MILQRFYCSCRWLLLRRRGLYHTYILLLYVRLARSMSLALAFPFFEWTSLWYSCRFKTYLHRRRHATLNRMNLLKRCSVHPMSASRRLLIWCCMFVDPVAGQPCRIHLLAGMAIHSNAIIKIVSSVAMISVHNKILLATIHMIATAGECVSR